MKAKETTLAVQQPLQKSKCGNFEPKVGITGATLHILKADADHSKSMKLLKEAGLVPFERQEILLLLMNDKWLKNALKGKWFYLAGKGLEKTGIYAIDEKGKLIAISDIGISMENKVRTWSGPNPLSLSVYSSDDVASCGGHFVLDADCRPDDVAPVVVGKHKLGLSKQADKLLGEVENAAQSLRRSGTQEDLETKTNELVTKATNLVKLLRSTQP